MSFEIHGLMAQSAANFNTTSRHLPRLLFGPVPVYERRVSHLTPGQFLADSFRQTRRSRYESSSKGVMGVGKVAVFSGIGIAALSGLTWALKRFLKSSTYDDLDSEAHHHL